MAAVTTVRDVLHRYSFARSVYQRFVGDCQCNQQVARNAVALLLCFDRRTNNNQLISQLPGMRTADLDRLLAEASFVIRCLQMRDVPAGPIMPLLTALCHDRRMADPDYFRVNRELIACSVAEHLDGVCRLIFDDRLYHLLRRHQTGLVGRNPELEAPYVGSVTVPEDCRSMFVTFAMGQAVERDEIFNYFRETWGDCVVRVLMEKTPRGVQPTYGRVVFKSKAFVSLLLNGDVQAVIIIGGCEIRLREYTLRNRSNN